MASKFTAPQAALLAKLPATFSLYENPVENAPPTEVRDSAGRTVFCFGKGEWRAFKGLNRAGAFLLTSFTLDRTTYTKA